MKNEYKFIIKIIILSMTFLIMIQLVYVYNKNHYGYAYISMNNDRGISNKCYANKKGLFCNSKRKVIEVKQYGKR